MGVVGNVTDLFTSTTEGAGNVVKNTVKVSESYEDPILIGPRCVKSAMIFFFMATIAFATAFGIYYQRNESNDGDADVYGGTIVESLSSSDINQTQSTCVGNHLRSELNQDELFALNVAVLKNSVLPPDSAKLINEAFKACGLEKP